MPNKPTGGRAVEYVGNIWVYADNGQPIDEVETIAPGMTQGKFYTGGHCVGPTDKTPRSTGQFLDDGDELFVGDTVEGYYGIPPLYITAIIECRDGQFGIVTPGHEPNWADLTEAIECLCLTKL